MGLAQSRFDAPHRLTEFFGKHLDSYTRGTFMKYISSCLVACAIAAASAPAAAVNTVLLDFDELESGGALAPGYGNPNTAATFTWTDFTVYTPGATLGPNKTIYSSGGTAPNFTSEVLIAAVGGQTISQIKFDYFTYYDSVIETDPTTNAWKLWSGLSLIDFGTMSAIGGEVNTDKPVGDPFELDLTPGLYSALRLTFDNDTAMGFDNFSVTAVPAIPEPETYALMLAGLGVVGFMARRRKAK